MCCCFSPLFQVLLEYLEEKIQAKNLTLQISNVGHFKTNTEGACRIRPGGVGMPQHSEPRTSAYVWKLEKESSGEIREFP